MSGTRIEKTSSIFTTVERQKHSGKVRPMVTSFQSLEQKMRLELGDFR